MQRIGSGKRVGALAAGWMLAGTVLAGDAEGQAQTTRLDEGLSAIEASFWRPLPRTALEDQALRALVARIDPYGRVFDAAEWNTFRNDFSGSLAGVGVAVEYDKARGLPRIDRLLIGSAAGGAGARRGDWIEAIDGRPLTGLSLDDVLPLLRGTAGSVVRLTLARADAPSQTITVTRKDHPAPSIHGVDRDAEGRARYVVDADRGIGYVRVAHLAEDSVSGVASALAQLSAAESCALVLDLRGSHGGLMRAGIGIADLFLAEGLITGSDGRKANSRHNADPAVAWAGPMVVLIDARTASSSEFLAAALRDHERARFMGERTFGKGLVQEMFSLGEGRGGFVLTTGRHVRPSGPAADRHDAEPDRQRAGVAPDPGLEIALEGPELEHWMQGMDLRASPVVVSPEELAAAGPDRILAAALSLLAPACPVRGAPTPH